MENLKEELAQEGLLSLASDESLKAKDFFSALKEDLKQKIASEDERSVYYQTILRLLKKAKLTNQTLMARKLIYHMFCIERQKDIKAFGIDSFVYLEDIKEYIERVEEKDVKICKLEDYPREIPDKVIEQIPTLNQLFTHLYVLYTDYTEEAPEELQEKFVEVEKDPILFGAIENGTKSDFDGRMYFIADWVDEYCDLTMDKLISEYKEITGHQIDFKLEEDELEELKKTSHLYNKDMSRTQTQATITFSGARNG